MALSTADIIPLRLFNQKLTNSDLTRPEDVVHWMGAMQAQEYAMAKWAIALRLKNKTTDEAVEKAFNEGRILRTHLMRPTWHFVSPEDIRWLLALTAPRVHQASSYMYRQLELDSKLFKKTNSLFEKALEGKFLIRTELQQLLKEKKIPADGLRLGYILMYAELEQLICSGPRKGKQFTYALMDERVPAVKEISREEALAKLADKYFRSRGPVTVQDFAYWSGLTVKDATAGVTSLGKNFIREKLDGKEFIFMPPDSKTKLHHDITFLMPDYDEYGMSYKDRSVIAPKQKLTGARSGSIVYNRMLVVNGRIEGSWQRELNKNVDVNIVPFSPLSKVQQQNVEKAVQRFQSFATSSKKSGK